MNNNILYFLSLITFTARYKKTKLNTNYNSFKSVGKFIYKQLVCYSATIL